MKVLQIDVSVNIGSTGRIAEQIGLKILQNNGESIIAFGRYEGSSKSKKIKIGNKFEQAHHLLLTRIFDKHGFGSVLGTKLFIKEIDKIDPDIIHLHNIHGYYINIEILFEYLIKSGKPVIWTLHDCWAYTGHCCYYSRYNCEKWKTECYKCPLTNYYPQSLVFDNSKNNYRIKNELFNALNNLTLVPVSDWLANEVSQSFLKSKNIFTIHNGVDINVFQYTDPTYLIEKHGLQGKKVLLGVASPWSDLKGLNDFIKLSAILDENHQIILIGLTASQIKSLPKNIIGITRLSDSSELVKYFSLADVFVNLSFAESFGLVTIEAMACGTPVVGYNLTATPELIKSGTGYVVEKSDITGIKKKIEKILQNGKKTYSNKCRQNVEEFYNIDTQYDKYIQLYKEKMSH
ncbi:MAG: glycosyltransferase [Saprospiraceae bacterium]